MELVAIALEPALGRYTPTGDMESLSQTLRSMDEHHGFESPDYGSWESERLLNCWIELFPPVLSCARSFAVLDSVRPHPELGHPIALVRLHEQTAVGIWRVG